MYLEEKHARLTVCPMSLSNNTSSTCGGRDCMAWRWRPEINPNWKPSDNIMLESNPRDYRTLPPPYIDSETHGYCGMATRPNVQG